MRRDRILRAERILSAGYDPWRDKTFVLWPKPDPALDAELERWRADFPDREPKVVRVVLHHSA